ncbi:MAG: putative ABC transporter permease [Ardenticatenaceae bacterium]|nr:putative ABC transporter permease [Ardenticatenaceae bacterium]HBY94608.1 hypothetical protein [Chloroflexota bacterium]
MIRRWLFYGLLGLIVEVGWTALANIGRSPDKRWLLKGQTSLWMLPIYGLIAPLYEPARDRLRPAPWWVRGLAYMAGFFAIEYSSGALLRRLVGDAPWDYSHTRGNLHGLIRLDYAPAWFAAGLALERLDTIIRPCRALANAPAEE